MSRGTNNWIPLTVGALALILCVPVLALADPPKIGCKGRIDGNGGLRITEIEPGGLAQASLKINDRIIEVDGMLVNSKNDVIAIDKSFANLQDGATVVVVYERGGKFYEATHKWSADTVSFGLVGVKAKN